jgi:hypothetical protein
MEWASESVPVSESAPRRGDSVQVHARPPAENPDPRAPLPEAAAGLVLPGREGNYDERICRASEKWGKSLFTLSDFSVIFPPMGDGRPDPAESRVPGRRQTGTGSKGRSQRKDESMTPPEKGNSSSEGAAPVFSRLVRSVAVALTNAVPLVGVIRLGWSPFALVFLFVLEGIVVLLCDSVKSRFLRITSKLKTQLFFECVFILFFGFFASLVFGPYDSLQSAVDDGFRRVGRLFMGELQVPLTAVASMRLARLVHDLADSGSFGGRNRRKLQLEGGGWMLLLFFASMAAPLVARSGPNPMGGLTALVVLKTLGEILAVWMERPDAAQARL